MKLKANQRLIYKDKTIEKGEVFEASSQDFSDLQLFCEIFTPAGSTEIKTINKPSKGKKDK